MDSGASNHMTVDSNNIQQKTNYNGLEKLVIDNGTSLSIHSTGSSILKLKHSNLYLTNMLHVPCI